MVALEEVVEAPLAANPTVGVDAFIGETELTLSDNAAAAAFLAGSFFVMGGEGNLASPVGVFAETERYDPSRDAWSSLAVMTTPRHGTGAAALDGVIYVPGGATTQAFGAVAVHQAFVP